MNKEEFLNKYFTYYESLEDDVIKSFRYVEPTKNNYKSYSIEYARLLQDICSEIEMLLKEIAKVDKEKNNDNFYALIDKVKMVDDISKRKVTMIKYNNIELLPFEERLRYNNRYIEWWYDHNKIKHSRIVKMNGANLYNVINALAALFILEDLLNKEIYKAERKDDLLHSKLYRTDYSKECSNEFMHKI